MVRFVTNNGFNGLDPRGALIEMQPEAVTRLASMKELTSVTDLARTSFSWDSITARQSVRAGKMGCTGRFGRIMMLSRVNLSGYL